MGNSWRITRKEDPVPRMVPTSTLGIFHFAYHTRREVFYDVTGSITPETSYTICNGNEVEFGPIRHGSLFKVECCIPI